MGGGVGGAVWEWWVGCVGGRGGGVLVGAPTMPCSCGLNAGSVRKKMSVLLDGLEKRSTTATATVRGGREISWSSIRASLVACAVCDAANCKGRDTTCDLSLQKGQQRGLRAQNFMSVGTSTVRCCSDQCVVAMRSQWDRMKRSLKETPVPGYGDLQQLLLLNPHAHAFFLGFVGDDQPQHLDLDELAKYDDGIRANRRAGVTDRRAGATDRQATIPLPDSGRRFAYYGIDLIKTTVETTVGGRAAVGGFLNDGDDPILEMRPVEQPCGPTVTVEFAVRRPLKVADGEAVPLRTCYGPSRLYGARTWSRPKLASCPCVLCTEHRAHGSDLAPDMEAHEREFVDSMSSAVTLDFQRALLRFHCSSVMQNTVLRRSTSPPFDIELIGPSTLKRGEIIACAHLRRVDWPGEVFRDKDYLWQFEVPPSASLASSPSASMASSPSPSGSPPSPSPSIAVAAIKLLRGSYNDNYIPPAESDADYTAILLEKDTDTVIAACLGELDGTNLKIVSFAVHWDHRHSQVCTCHCRRLLFGGRSH